MRAFSWAFSLLVLLEFGCLVTDGHSGLTAQEVPPTTPSLSTSAPQPASPEASRLQVSIGQAENSPAGAVSPKDTALRIESPNNPVSESAALPSESPPTSVAPRPDPKTNTAPLTVEAAAFNGVTPGVSHVNDLTRQWGPPKEAVTKGDSVYYLYEIPPFDRIEVHIQNDKVEAIIIRLDKTYPANLVAEHLELSQFRPVLVSNPQGEVLGQTFPERGVLFSFAPAPEPGKSSNLVTEIILSEVTAEPFILRAETFWQTEPDSAIRDLEQALKFDNRAHRAWWLLARIQKELGSLKEALASAQNAVNLDPASLHYRLTLAEILDEVGQDNLAIQQLEQVVAASDQRPHIKARALCNLGNIYQSLPQPDYKKALDYHYEAVKIAQPLRSDVHPAIRVAAKEVLVDAHLGAALDIAWGPWEQKEAVVPRWLERAANLAQDLVNTEQQSADKLFRVSTTALATSVAMPRVIGPLPWIEALDQAYQRLEAEASEVRRARLRWNYGVALYDAVQCFQVLGEQELAQQYGKKAAEALETGLQGRSPKGSDLYLLGRLYFRLGAVDAIQNKDHKQAVTYFDKAIPLLRQAAGDIPETSIGRLGETFVSMGVSYWETGDRDQAIALTEEGLQWMEKAVQLGLLANSALDVPRANLQTMRQARQRLAERTSSDTAAAQR